MTKKVLISWEDLRYLLIDFINTVKRDDVVNLRPALKWFDAQPDIHSILADAKEDFLKHMKCAKAQKRIFTGVHEDDN